jgi:peptide/nickel transport system substrate-binding protein
MRDHLRVAGLLAALALVGLACQPAAPTPAKNAAGTPSAGQAPTGQAAAPASGGPTRVVVGVTETLESQNPYGDSVALAYGIWCEVLGCLVSLDPRTLEYAPALAERWEVENPTTWVFHLRRNVTWHDGSPFTSADVAHSLNRIRTDRDSKQRQNLAMVTDVQVVDDYTIKLITKEPTADLLAYFADMLIITSKAQYDQFGPDGINQQPPLGTGPYVFKELIPKQRMVIAKNPRWWGGPVDGPDEVVYRIMPEAEVRITALLNGELQIAEFVPPHMIERVSNAPNAKFVSTDSIELMFLAMQPKVKPWDNPLVRQAVGYAIDRDAIIQSVLHGQARRLEGVVGPGTTGYDPHLRSPYTYNPEKARQLLAQAGYPNGVDVELATPVNRYVQDKQSMEAVAAMLTAVGIRTRLLTPEWATLWDDVRAGKVPFYYMGRGGVVDAGVPLSQYFETGISPRIGYSNPQVDALFSKQRATFEPNERKQVLSELMSRLLDEAPAQFLWTINMGWGLAKNIEYQPRVDVRIFANDIRVK